MSITSFDKIYSRFYDKVENDTDFFDYYNHTSEESMEIARERAKSYLNEAVDIFTLKCTPTVDFFDVDSENDCFNFEVTTREIEVLSRIMYTIYLERDISKLKPILNSLTATDIKSLFSPANERKTFESLLNWYKNKTDVLISHYAARDRLTGQRRTINYEG
ncbi:MAG: hypothetical protein UHN59_04920 [Bacteroidales bacterium]|jgi:hypothetical protein|nr:hypothetical protein [Bacteroidales bacterium]